jgi:di/tricarboxylate transporter
MNKWRKVQFIAFGIFCVACGLFILDFILFGQTSISIEGLRLLFYSALAAIAISAIFIAIATVFNDRIENKHWESNNLLNCYLCIDENEIIKHWGFLKPGEVS